MPRQKKEDKIRYVLANEKYDEMLEKIIDKYYMYFSHIEPKEIIVLEDIETDKREKGGKLKFADVSLIPSRSKDVYQQLSASNTPKKYYLTIYINHCEHMNDNQIKLLLFHELLHIGENGKLVDHDLQDFEVIIKRCGVGYLKEGSMKAQPDILDPDFDF